MSQTDPFTPLDLVQELQPDPLPAYPDPPTLEPDFQEEPEPLAVLAQPAACRICRGAGIDLIFQNTDPYYTHIRQTHPESLPPIQ